MAQLAGLAIATFSGSIFPGCLALRADFQQHSFTSSSLSRSEHSSCSTCSDLVQFVKHVGIAWEIFPPSPLPAIDGAITCLPSSHVKWGPGAAEQVESALDDEDCGLGEAHASLSRSEKRDCRQLHAKQSKRASWLGLPVAFLQQMAVCGRCGLCEAFSKVSSLWRRLKAAVRKVAAKLRQVKRKLFGYSYASSRVRSAMARRFDGYFPDGATSALQTASDVNHTDGESGDIDDATHEKMVEEALLQELRKKSPEQMDQHLSLLQQRLEDTEQKDEELMGAAQRKFRAEFDKQRSQLELQLPTLLGNEHCQAFLDASMSSQTLELTLYVEVPHIVNAILHAVVGNFVGALHSLLPKIQLLMTPHLGGAHDRQHHMDQCLQALHEQRQPFLDSCTHEQPLMACTARTYQRLMQGALSQQWWPLMHNEVGTTVGSIDLGYDYDELMESLECSSRGSCLEKGLDAGHGSEDLKAVLENSSTDEAARFAELQCSFAGNRIDTEDAEKGKLPVFSDKIWAATLKAHGKTMEFSPAETPPCPNMMPFVVAFCAESLHCMDAERAGQGFGSGVFEVARARAKERMKEIQNITRESTAPVGKYGMTESDDFNRLKDWWWTMISEKASHLDPEEDVYQWNLLWQAANFTNKVGHMATWPAIRAALDGEETEAIDWIATRDYWERVLMMSVMKLNVRQLEMKENGSPVLEKRSLPAVLKNLRSIFDTKFCSPGALGGLTDQNLRRLGVHDQVSLTLAHIDRDSVVIKQWQKWSVLNLKIRDKSRLQKFKDQLAESSCSCMCYNSCSKLKASAYVSCHTGLRTFQAARESALATLHADEVILDRVYSLGEKLQDADLSIVEVPGWGGCQYKLEMQYRQKGPATTFSSKKSKLSGYISQCQLPDFVKLSKGDLRITIWESKGDRYLGHGWDMILEPNQNFEDVDLDVWNKNWDDASSDSSHLG
mmetsp:Transcript_15313/g.36050  ORF Transcript_15313/g.36050 Transcript_15313/m.36050 type:complete len:951 (-) Transcript_15313:182-3034(-)